MDMGIKKGRPLLCLRMKMQRERNRLTMEEMACRLHTDKSTISRIEAGGKNRDTVAEYAARYCEAFNMSREQTEYFLRGGRVAVPDTSALLRNPQLIDELPNEYSEVVVPDTVIGELSHIKDKNRNKQLGAKAWKVLGSISGSESITRMDYSGDPAERNSDKRIIQVARAAAERFGCHADVITNDIDFKARLRGDEFISAVHLNEYMKRKQDIVDMRSLLDLRDCYDGEYSRWEGLSKNDLNVRFADGHTLIISAVRSHCPLDMRRDKITWLIAHGADVDLTDCSTHYLPPLSHAIQMDDLGMFQFLLYECGANPNIGSRNPYSSDKLRQKNEGNMPLMIAAWHGRADFVKALCEDERTSLNQQDANGFTALIKSSRNGHEECRRILLDHGADTKIVDMNGKTAEDHHALFMKNMHNKEGGRR